jgi:hypothetical protein
VTRRMSVMWRLPVVMLAVAGALELGAVHTASASASVGSVKVMDPEDAGDGALIGRAKAQRRAEQGLPGQGNSSSGNGCSDINIGNIQGTKPWQRPPTKVVNIIEGPIIQENKCR